MIEIAKKLADQINIIEESKIESLILEASIESGIEYKLLERAAGNAYYEKYERGNYQAQQEYRVNSR